MFVCMYVCLCVCVCVCVSVCVCVCVCVFILYVYIYILQGLRGSKLLVYEALSYQCMRPQATSV